MVPVRLEFEGDVGVVVIDNPPINAASLDVRKGLLEAISLIGADPNLVAGVLIGAGRNFIAGSDIKEFGGPLAAPELPQVIAAIEASRKPFVAALAGAALGGGYELALGCDLRIAAPDAVVGLPEVTLGMIPGAGGTQRLPRLVGAATAIDLICTGRRVEALEAQNLGMIDEIADGSLRRRAVERARALDSRKHRISSDVVRPGLDGALAAATERAMKAGRGRPAVAAAIEAICSAIDRPFAASLAAERDVFTQLRGGAEAAALRYLFFAERRASRGPEGVTGKDLGIIGVVGAGTMGAAIAATLLDAGLQVILVDSDALALSRGVAAIAAIFERWRAAGRVLQADPGIMLARLVPARDLTSLRPCDGVVEAIVEEMGAKIDLLDQIAAIVRTDTLIASNTSYLDLDALASAIAFPERVLGLHFFNPAHIMRLPEVVQAGATSAQTVADGLLLARRIGKQAVVAGVGHGFIGNRIYAAYRRHCEFMLEDGAWPEQIDAALQGFGFAMGPFATGDMSGLDGAWAMRKAQAATRDAADRYCVIPDRLCEAGRFGRKTGKGYYDYPDNDRRGHPDAEVRALIEAVSAERNIARRRFEAREIVARALAAMVNEAVLLIVEDVARRASDVDVVMTNGFGFPRHEGGLLFWASRQDRAGLHWWIDALERSAGETFRRANIDPVLDAIEKD